MTENKTKISYTSKKKKGLQETKIGWIPYDWNVVKLGDVGEVINGLTYSPNDISEDGILVLRSSNVQNRQLEFNDNVYVNVEDEKFNPVEEKDILICVRNGSRSLIGKNALINKENQGVAFGAFMTVYRSEYNDFFFQLFDTDIYNKEVNKNLGATINSINGKDFKRFLMPLPPKVERVKIASILSDWDDAIEKTQILLDKLELRKKGLMQQLLTGKIRLDGFSDKWKEYRFGNLITERKEFPPEPLPLYSLTIESGVVPKTDRYERSFLLKSTKDAYKTMHQNDFALNPMNLRFGAIARYKDEPKISVSRYYNIFHFNNSCNSVYMEYYLSSYNMVQYYNKMAIGSLEEKKRVHYSDFVNFKKLLPNLIEQNAIVEVLQTADLEIDQHKNHLTQLQSQKKGLMQQLLTGKIRVKV